MDRLRGMRLIEQKGGYYLNTTLLSEENTTTTSIRSSRFLLMCVRVCVRACVRACARACVRACVHRPTSGALRYVFYVMARKLPSICHSDAST